MAEQSLDRIRQWETRTGGFINVSNRSSSINSGGGGVPF